MSEFVLPKVHIDVLLTAALAWQEDFARCSVVVASSGPPAGERSVELATETADAVGRVVWGQNFDMAAEYVGFELPELDADLVAALDEDSRALFDEVNSYVFEPVPGEPNPTVVLNAISCYLYQTRPETPEEWIATPAAPFMHRLQGLAEGRLPGMRRVPWPIEDRDIFTTWTA